MITEISPFAFDTNAFRNTTTLVLSNLKIHVFNNDTFSGLNSLTSLKIYSISTYTFTHGVLSGVASTLESFLLFGIYTNMAISIDEFTGGIQMPSLAWVRIMQNLSHTVTNKTFTGTVNVETIDLSGCSIVQLGRGTFDPVKNSLIRLKLERNYLKTLPNGFFKCLLPNYNLLINLAQNPWHCDCELYQFQWYLEKNTVSFVEQPLCESPSNLANSEVISVVLCDDDENYAVNRPPNEYLNLDDPNLGMQNQECCSAPKLNVCEILRTKFDYISNEISLYTENIQNKIYASNSDLFVIWFDQNASRKICKYIDTKLECISGLLDRDLLPNTVYTICIFHKFLITLTPYHCMPYFQKPNQSRVWLYESDSTTLILVVTLIFSLCIAFGSWIGYYVNNILKQYKSTMPEIPKMGRSLSQPNKDEIKYVKCLANIIEKLKFLNIKNVLIYFRKFGQILERGYETAIYPSRFEIVQRQLEMAKYLQMENPSYRERIPCNMAPSLPEKNFGYGTGVICSDEELDSQSNHSYYSLEQYRCTTNI